MADTILFVDDEPAVLEGLTRALRREPYELLTATSGDEALEIMEYQKVDVVVSDERMPGMGGSELLAEVRDRHPDTVRIMLTGAASVESAMSAIHDGWVFQYLHKPCRAADLASAIHYGLLLRSLATPEEDPVRMSPAQQEDLLAQVGKDRPSSH